MIRWARAPRGRLTVLLSAAMSLMAAAGAHAQQPAAEPALLIQLGAQLYQREGCPLCHRIRGEGGAVGPVATAGSSFDCDRTVNRSIGCIRGFDSLRPLHHLSTYKSVS